MHDVNYPHASLEDVMNPPSIYKSISHSELSCHDSFSFCFVKHLTPNLAVVTPALDLLDVTLPAERPEMGTEIDPLKPALENPQPPIRIPTFVQVTSAACTLNTPRTSSSPPPRRWESCSCSGNDSRPNGTSARSS